MFEFLHFQHEFRIVSCFSLVKLFNRLLKALIKFSSKELIRVPVSIHQRAKLKASHLGRRLFRDSP